MEASSGSTTESPYPGHVVIKRVAWCFILRCSTSTMHCHCGTSGDLTAIIWRASSESTQQSNTTAGKMAKVAVPQDTTTPARLPSEIWMVILHRSDYFTLKKMYLVSKLFHHLLSSKSFDDALFRIDPVHVQLQPYSEDIQYRVHPILENAGQFLDFSTEPKFEELRIRAKHSGKTWRLADLTLINESATMPPVDHARLAVDYLLSIEARPIDPSKVVTVSSVCKGIEARVSHHARGAARGTWNAYGRLGTGGNFVGWDAWKKGELGPEGEERWSPGTSDLGSNDPMRVTGVSSLDVSECIFINAKFEGGVSASEQARRIGRWPRMIRRI